MRPDHHDCTLCSRATTSKGAHSAHVHPPLCMLLRTLCLHASERSHALVRWDGAGAMFASLLLPVQPPSSARSFIEGGEWLRMLLADVCLRDGFFVELTTALASVSSFAGERCFADGQLLLVLAEAVDASVDFAPGSGESVPARLVRQLDRVSQVYSLILPQLDNPSAASEAQQRLLDSLDCAAQACASSPDPAARVIVEGGLCLLRAVAGRDSALSADGARKVGFLEALFLPAACSRLTALILTMLDALGPPSGPRPKGSPSVTPASPSRHQPLPTASTQRPRADLAAYPACSIYSGYRRDLVAVLANACHKRPHVTRDIVAAGSCSR